MGDGSFQVTCQDLSTMIRYGQKPIVFLLNNDGYTIERVIVDRPYNDIQPWKYHRLVEVFGGGLAFDVHTEGQLEAALAQAAAGRRARLHRGPHRTVRLLGIPPPGRRGHGQDEQAGVRTVAAVRRSGLGGHAGVAGSPASRDCKASGFTGLTMWRLKPASCDLFLSSSCPHPVMATSSACLPHACSRMRRAVS